MEDSCVECDLMNCGRLVQEVIEERISVCLEIIPVIFWRRMCGVQ